MGERCSPLFLSSADDRCGVLKHISLYEISDVVFHITFIIYFHLFNHLHIYT